MSQMIQPLESRMLLTAATSTLVADSAAVTAAANNSKSALAAFRAEEVSLLKLVNAEVKVTQTKSQRGVNGRLVTTLIRTEGGYYNKVAGGQNQLILNARVRAAAAVGHGKLLNLKPTKVAYQTAVAKDISLLDTIIPAKLEALETLVTTAQSEINNVYSGIEIEDPQVTDVITSGENTAAADATAFTTAATSIETAAAKLANDLSTPLVSTTSLTGATLFRTDSSGANLGTTGVINYGVWSSGLDVQNVPNNYVAEYFVSRVPNPTSTADFIFPGSASAALTTGDNTFYFWADGDDTTGGTFGFGLNLFLNSNATSSPSISGYTTTGTGQTLLVDSAATTPAVGATVVSGAGTLTSGTVTLSSFQVLGVGGSAGNSTVDKVNSTNTAPFSFPVDPDGTTDTYGTFTLHVTG